MRNALVWILGFLHLCRGQSGYDNDRRFGNRRPIRPLGIHQQSSTPCGGGGGYGGESYDSVEDDEGRSLLLLGGAAVGGAALGYHIGMKHKQPVVINNNIHNDYPPPCVVVQSGGGGGIGGGGGGGGIIGGILGNHPILSNILQGGLWNGGGEGAAAQTNRLPINRQNNINWNRAIRQFNRVITRVFR